MPAALEARGPCISVGVGIGPYWGGPYYRPWGYYGPYYGYYGPYPYYYPPPAVVVQPAPPQVIVQPAPAPAVAPPAAAPQQPTPIYRGAAPTVTTTSASSGSAALDENLKQLVNADENTRQNAVMELGRMGADSAVDPLSAALAGDASPLVREAAARALGLIAAPRSLPALIRAAQADKDREVRHSAQFAVEAIRSRLRPN
jgi:hypothetical protein